MHSFDNIFIVEQNEMREGEVREVILKGHVGWTLSWCRIWLKACPSFDDEVLLYDSNPFFPRCSNVIRSVAYNVIRQHDVEGFMVKTCKGQYSFELYSKSFWCNRGSFDGMLENMKNLARIIGNDIRSGIEG